MPSRSFRQYILAALMVLVVIAAVAFLLARSFEEDGALRASGTVEVVSLRVAAELAGRVTQVHVQEGEWVQAGQALFQLDDELHQAQRRLALVGLESAIAGRASAETAVDAAEAALNTAHLQAEAAQIQYEMALNAALFEARAGRLLAWKEIPAREFNLPIWYFQKGEKLAALELASSSAKEAYEMEKVSLSSMLAQSSHHGILEVEERLRDAQAEFLIADDLLRRAKAQQDQNLVDFAQTSFDEARDELENAQSAYDELLSDETAQELLEARARLAVARERYDTAIDQTNQLRSGEDSLKVLAAEIALRLAEAAIAQTEAQLAQAQSHLQVAQKAVAQAEAQLDLLDIQISKLVVYAPVSGLVRVRNIEAGEILQPGSPAMTLDQLGSLTITVYVPEDRYGQIRLGDHAQVAVDSFPDEAFDAIVTRIADRAEFTPRNVQTEEGRRTTVFAIQLSVSDPSGLLKPGMPADVTFDS